MATVLIVDDERDLVNLLDFNFRQTGFETILAENGEQREKLGPARHLLETVRGIGYRLIDPADRQ